MFYLKTLLAVLIAGLAFAIPASSTASTPAITHVVMILEENHSITSVTSTSMPYLTSLGNKYARATHISGVGHPSLPNYLALTEGNTGYPTSYIGSDCGSSTSGCMQKSDNIYHQADTAGKSWRQWSEGMQSNCASSNGGTAYIVHHAPAPFYSDLMSTDCKTNDVIFNKSSVPAITAGFTFLSPNKNDDAHDGTLLQADNWLKVVVPKLLASPNYTNGSTLIEITFDEGSGSNNTVYTAFINPALSNKVVTLTANHYSVLRLNEELLGFPLLSHAQTASDLKPALFP